MWCVDDGIYASISLKCHNISAHLWMSLHQEQGLQHELVQLLSRWYFEEAKELSINRTWPHIPSMPIKYWGPKRFISNSKLHWHFKTSWHQLTLPKAYKFPRSPPACWVPPFASFQDISDSTVLRAAVEKVGLNGAETLQRSEELRGTIQQRYEDLTHLTHLVPVVKLWNLMILWW